MCLKGRMGENPSIHPSHFILFVFPQKIKWTLKEYVLKGVCSYLKLMGIQPDTARKKRDMGIIKLIQEDKSTTKAATNHCLQNGLPIIFVLSFKFPRAGVISSDGLFCPTNGPEPKDSLTIISDKEKQKILTSQKL